MLLGYARGKVGDLVFTRRNGQQVTRTRVRVVNNPKTVGQQIQRMIFATVIIAFSRMKSICDHSFEGVKYGADSQAKFMSENLKRLRAYYPTSADPRLLVEFPAYQQMAFALPNNRAHAGCGLIIARGTIAAPAPVANENNELKGFGYELGETASVGNVLNALGAEVGDQITVVALNDDGSFDKSRYVIKDDATTTQLQQIWQMNGNADAFDAKKTIIGAVKLQATANNPCTIVSVNSSVAVGLIISRRDASGKWLRSDAVLYNQLDESPQYQADYALPYWQFEGTDIATADPRFLNNADI